METSFRCRADVPDIVLIVDDSEMNRALLANIFAGSYLIEMAENGREGLVKLRQHGQRVCAILLDVVMPVMDGRPCWLNSAKRRWSAGFPCF